MLKDRAFLLKGITLSALTVIFSLVGQEWAPNRSLFSSVAPVAGLALAALFLGGIGYWPFIFLATTAGRLIAHPDAPPLFSIVFGIINTSAYIAAATYLRRRKIRRDLSSLLDISRLIVAAAILASITSFGPLLASLAFVDEPSRPVGLLQDLVEVFFGRFTGALLVGSFILTFAVKPLSSTLAAPLRQRAFALIGTTLVTTLVFGPLHIGKPITWVMFPPLVLAALLGGVSLTAKALLIVATGALWGTTAGYGPFAEVVNRFAMLQQFLAVVSLTTLILAAVSTERKEKKEIQQRSLDLEFLSDVAVELLSSSELTEAVKKLIPGLATRCNVETVTFHTASPEAGEPLRLVALHRVDDTALGVLSLQDIEACVSQVLEGKPPLVPLLQHSTPGDVTSAHTCLCVPVGTDGSLLGVLSIASHSRKKIDRAEAQLVETVAYYVATAARRLNQERKLRESEVRFRELANAVPDIVWVSRPDGTNEFLNKRWYEFTGEKESEEELSRSIVDLCEPSQRDDVARRWSESIRAGERFEMEHQLKHHSGGFRWVLTRAAPAHDTTGAIVRWFGTCTDLNDKRMLEAERDALLQSERAARMEAERASRIKDDFLATLSHELRNPLNVILGWAHLLSRGGVDGRKAGEIIEHSGRLQAQLIEDLLDMSRIVSGKLSLRQTVVNASDVVASTCESMQLAARAKGVRVETQVEPDLELAHADVSRITQIVSNLLTNAIKFTPSGGRVMVKLGRDGEDALLTVRDTGEGISPDFLPHLFDRFRQADPSTTRRHGGLGIGLSIAKHMTELHGGSITATSPGLGQGSTFTVRIPFNAHPDETSIRASLKGARPREHHLDRLAGAHIVVVEDDPPTLEFLSRFLSERGALVSQCESGQAALDQVQSKRPDIVISDIGMPGMDGYQLVRKIRETCRYEPHIPLVAVTAFARAEDETKALQAGFDAHLPKPLDMHRLEQVLLGLLDSDPSQRAVNAPPP